MKKIIVISVTAVVGALLGAIAMWLWLPATTSVTTSTAMAKDEAKVLYWYDPMYPQQHFDKPGPSPFMDMELVAKYADNSRDADNNNTSAGVKIATRQLQNINIRLATVQREHLAPTITALGVLSYSERDQVIEQARANGFVEDVAALAVGDRITRGQFLLSVRVPEWTAAQREWLLLRAQQEGELLHAARGRLLQLGMPEHDVLALEKTGEVQTLFSIRAAHNGVIRELQVRRGMTISPGQTLLQSSGIETLWLDVFVAEAQASNLQRSAAVSAVLTAFPGQTVHGKIADLLPELNDSNRSVRVRINVPNTQGQLLAGMSAQVQLPVAAAQDVLTVPSEAVIRTGKRAVVICAGDNGEFFPIEVVLGVELGDRLVVRDGLQEGEKIVASGQFLLDSEAGLSSVLTRTRDDKNDAETDDNMTQEHQHD